MALAGLVGIYFLDFSRNSGAWACVLQFKNDALLCSLAQWDGDLHASRLLTAQQHQHSTACQGLRRHTAAVVFRMHHPNPCLPAVAASIQRCSASLTSGSAGTHAGSRRSHTCCYHHLRVAWLGCSTQTTGRPAVTAIVECCICPVQLANMF